MVAADFHPIDCHFFSMFKKTLQSRNFTAFKILYGLMIFFLIDLREIEPVVIAFKSLKGILCIHMNDICKPHPVRCMILKILIPDMIDLADGIKQHSLYHTADGLFVILIGKTGISSLIGIHSVICQILMLRKGLSPHAVQGKIFCINHLFAKLHLLSGNPYRISVADGYKLRQFLINLFGMKTIPYLLLQPVNLRSLILFLWFFLGTLLHSFRFLKFPKRLHDLTVRMIQSQKLSGIPCFLLHPADLPDKFLYICHTDFIQDILNKYPVLIGQLISIRHQNPVQDIVDQLHGNILCFCHAVVIN